MVKHPADSSVESPSRQPAIAFYAPLKPPSHPNPSGDRLLAQLFLQALRQAGFAPKLASIFRSYEGQGDPQRQQRIKALGERLAQRLIRHYQRLPAEQRPKLWFSYHLYHKAPDWIGPIVSRALKIPYVVAEASYAAKQRTGAWQQGLAGSVEALQQAALILCLNPADKGGIGQCRTAASVQTLAPFLDLTAFRSAPGDGIQERKQLAQQYRLDPDIPWLICVAMMRPGDKLHSYRLLARSLLRLNNSNWQLIVIGDGTVRSEVEALFSPLSESVSGRVCFTGALPPRQVQSLLRASDLYLWPAVNEAFGMALLEAQAAATPVLAGDEGGVRSVVATSENSGWLIPSRDSDAFADQLEQLLQQIAQQPQQWSQTGIKVRNYIEQHHSLEAAGERLRQLLLPLIETDQADPHLSNRPRMSKNHD